MSAKSEALSALMKDIMKMFLMKEETGDLEVDEGTKVEEEEHPQLGKGEAQDVAKQHLQKDPEAYEDEKEGKPFMMSMSRLAVKKEDKEEKKEDKKEDFKKKFGR